MVSGILTKIFGSKNERDLRKISPLVEVINGLEPSYQKLTDAELKAKTDEFKKRLADGETLDDLLPDAFAAVRETSVRTLKMRHFDVQLVGGVVLHQGKIAEMKTGEGKTLVATLAVYLNALTGKGVHVVTVNDYLARRDAEWMGQIYRFLGLSFGTIVHGLDDRERYEVYRADVTYGTNNEFGFDYLRDNMKHEMAMFVQRPHNFAIVDEVDSILIDEARTPLIISGPTEDSTDKYYVIDRVIPKLKKERDFTVDEKARSSMLTDEGIQKVEGSLNVENLYAPSNIETLHHVNQALKAHALFQRDVDYVVKDGQVIIVDEFTGRLMPGRRYSDGLHQALEAKENVRIENENQTLATITFQNYFRMYEKLAGMTGTADTEATEFKKIYDLDVMVIPTNEPMIRTDNPDVVYKTEKEKFRAVINEIIDCYERGQPALVGTISIEKSEHLSKLLSKEKVPHNVLNAKHHEGEAQIVALAGRYKAVTISTNMAGRGTDIILGGNPEIMAKNELAQEHPEEDYTQEQFARALEAAEQTHQKERELVLKESGLHILGTERHESRRIDNQLRGRSGRQGDPGTSRFYLSLEDDLLRIFGSERISRMMDTLGIEEDQPIEHNWISKAIENAQRKVEGHNFDIRKHLLEYDDVMNLQRDVVYRQRRDVLSKESLRDDIGEMAREVAGELVATHCPADKYPEDWNLAELAETLRGKFTLELDVSPEKVEEMTLESLEEQVYAGLEEIYEAKEKEFGSEMMRRLEKFILLQTIDNIWKDHLLTMDHLKQGIGLRGYGQRNPLDEYKREAYETFQEMIFRIKEDAAERIFRIQMERDTDREEEAMRRRRQQRMTFGRGALAAAGGGAAEAEPDEPPKPQPVRRKIPKVGRNDPCPCGSGKKYKKCCGA